MRDETNGGPSQGPMTYNTDVPGRVDPTQPTEEPVVDAAAGSEESPSAEKEDGEE